MKITDVTLTLFAWPGIPSTTYGRHTGRFGGDGQLGLLTLATDAGVVGHAFLGSAMRGAHLDGASLIEVLKPVVHRPGPARPRAPVSRVVAAEPVDHGARDRRGGRGALGPGRQGRGAPHPPAARLVPGPRPRVRELGRPRLPRGLWRGGGALQGRGLDRLQDPSAHRSGRRTSRSARRCGVPSATATR